MMPEQPLDRNYHQRLQAIQDDVRAIREDWRAEVHMKLLAEGSDMHLGAAALFALDALVSHLGAVQALVGHGVDALYRPLD